MTNMIHLVILYNTQNKYSSNNCQGTHTSIPFTKIFVVSGELSFTKLEPSPQECMTPNLEQILRTVELLLHNQYNW